MSQYFENFDAHTIKNALIFLDVDGTLVADNQDSPSDEVLKKIKSISEHNVVWLCSNSFNGERNEVIRKLTGLPITRGHRKPSLKILNLVDKKDLQRKMVVIGDKVLTDGFFARRIGAEFVKVKRKTGDDRLRVKLYNLLDDTTYALLKRIS